MVFIWANRFQYWSIEKEDDLFLNGEDGTIGYRISRLVFLLLLFIGICALRKIIHRIPFEGHP